MFVKFQIKRRTLPLTRVNAYSVSIGDALVSHRLAAAPDMSGSGGCDKSCRRLECARNPRSVALADSFPTEERAQAAWRYLERLDRSIEVSPFDVEDRRAALQEGRQDIGLCRRPTDIA
jgi:hypothetical protein